MRALWCFSSRGLCVDLRDFRHWWSRMMGANWRRPMGRKQHQIVGQSSCCSLSFWMRSLTRVGPARTCRPRPNGNLPHGAGSLAPIRLGRRIFARWRAHGQHLARRVSRENLAEDGFERTSPVTAFPPNGYGLYDMIGNVWEWTQTGTRQSTWPTRRRPAASQKSAGGREDDKLRPRPAGHRIPRKVIKGGSFFAPNYCLRYRPAARPADRSIPRRATSGFAA